MIFTRSNSDALTSLVKKIDAATAQNKSKKMGSFVVYLSDDEALEDQLKALAQKEGIKNIVLTIDNVAGPKGYEVSKDADVTVVLYNQRNVKANHAFKKGELNAKAIEAIVADVPTILD
jgi:predicted P-loop ATPase